MIKLLFLKRLGECHKVDTLQCLLCLTIKLAVENLLKGIIIASGNDACVALAEGISGSEKEFVIINE